LLLLPFIAVWVAYLLTAFSFDPKWVFVQEGFWRISIVYWMFYLFALLVEWAGDCK
jgi:hypothetical protein